MSQESYPEKNSWDWDKASREIADVSQWIASFPEVQEFAVSPDGERIAAIVMTDEEEFTVCVNGELWTNRFEKAWSLKFSPAGILFCIGMNNDEWTVIQEDQPWEETFDYVWNMKFSADGSGAGVNIRTSDGYGVALNGITWENKFVQMRSLEVSPDGKRAAGNIQLESLNEGDIFSFRKGLWSLAVDGECWSGHFLNVWDGAFSVDGAKIAAEVRLLSGSQTIAIDGVPWTRSSRPCGDQHLSQAHMT